MTQQKENFVPIQKNKIGIYVCGMTVYDFCHLGHARVLVCFDVITRFLRSRNFDVTYVRNITDIDDKIITRAIENNESIESLTSRFIDAMHEDEKALRVLPPDREPLATQHIDHMIAMISKLIENKAAYVGDNGDVFFDVAQYKEYGALSHKDLSGQEAGARVDIVSEKRNPLDFVLWKKAKANEPFWPSPWGDGRPGWHIECSAMSKECLGDHFDIHGGGFDLIFPHHENEIAQSRASSHKEFVNTWMHVGYLQINREKMSKSLGNFFTIRDVLTQYPREVVRYFLLSSHYRSQLNYSTENLDIAKTSLSRLYNAQLNLPAATALQQSEFETRFIAAMEDDFNTPEALAVLFDLASKINVLRDSDTAQAAQLAQLLKQLGNVLGLLEDDAHDYFQEGLSAETISQIELLVAQRNQARAQKQWQLADELRAQLHQLGVEIDDRPDGTGWRKK